MPLPHPFRGRGSLSFPPSCPSRDPLDAGRDSHSWAVGDTRGDTWGHPTPHPGADVGHTSLGQIGVPRDRQGPRTPLGSEGILRVEEYSQCQGQRVAPGLPPGQVRFPRDTWGPPVPGTHGDTLLGRWGPRGSNRTPEQDPRAGRRSLQPLGQVEAPPGCGDPRGQGRTLHPRAERGPAGQEHSQFQGQRVPPAGTPGRQRPLGQMGTPQGYLGTSNP